jgi:hypothetical protein
VTEEDLKQLRRLSTGFVGRFEFDPAHEEDHGLGNVADCVKVGDRLRFAPDGFDVRDDEAHTISDCIDEHVAVPIAEMLNAVPVLLDEVERLSVARDNAIAANALMRQALDERDAYRTIVCNLLTSSHPHPVEHPTMTKQWARARELLKNGVVATAESAPMESRGTAGDFLRAALAIDLTTAASRADGICRSCGLRDGTHASDCRAAAAEARARLQADCDHRREYGLTRTTGDPPGPPCCGRCGKQLELTTVATSMDIVLTGALADNYRMHILSQDGQPYGSERRCCNNCGVMIWGEVIPAHVDNWTDWRAHPNRCENEDPRGR